MENRLTKFICIMIVVSVIILSGSVIGSLMHVNNEKDIELSKALNDVSVWKHDAEQWKNTSSQWQTLYENYDCPEVEPEIIIRYINTTLYSNNTIYIDNAIFDVNRDGIVDYKDVCEVWAYIKGHPTVVEDWFFNKYGNPYEKLYDVNADGCVNATDVELILAYAD